MYVLFPPSRTCTYICKYIYIYQTHTRRHYDITESYVYDKHDMEIDENIHWHLPFLWLKTAKTRLHNQREEMAIDKAMSARKTDQQHVYTDHQRFYHDMPCDRFRYPIPQTCITEEESAKAIHTAIRWSPTELAAMTCNSIWSGIRFILLKWHSWSTRFSETKPFTETLNHCKARWLEFTKSFTNAETPDFYTPKA
jgi:hypothetical protein